jgi:hypothetical protein
MPRTSGHALIHPRRKPGKSGEIKNPRIFPAFSDYSFLRAPAQLSFYADRYALAPDLAAAAQNGAAGPRRHPRAEPVGAHPARFRRLICSFCCHGKSLDCSAYLIIQSLKMQIILI